MTLPLTQCPCAKETVITYAQGSWWCVACKREFIPMCRRKKVA